MIVNIHEAKTHFSKFVEKALQGEEIIIAKGGKPLIQLVPYAKEITKRRGGQFKGLIEIREDFDDALPDDLLKLFYEDKK